MTIIRRADEDDATALAQSAERLFRDTFASANDPADIDSYCRSSFSVDHQRGEILNPGYLTLLAEDGGSLIGYAQLRWDSQKNGVDGTSPVELFRLYISHERHGQGVAQQVMEEILSAARNHDADAIWLGVWERNPKAIAFYRKYGFEPVGEQVFRVGSDPQRDLVMARGIDH